jgi:predicted nucleic acid-binding protein
MARDVFFDTSGLYALLVSHDDRHAAAVEFMRSASARSRRFVTTDYVINETATLLQARRHWPQTTRLFEGVLSSRACRVIWMDAERFGRIRDQFLRTLERGWSFTDCLSFDVMRELHLREALAKDAHFREAGFTALLM